MDYNRIYAYTTVLEEDKEWVGERKGKGLIKVGQTLQDTEERVRQQLQGSPTILKRKQYKILFDEEALDINGKYFKDADVFKYLKLLGAYRIPKTEWFECTLEEVKEAFKKAYLKIPCRTLKSYKEKNVIENRGGSYNKKEAERERAFIKNADRIVNIMKIYPEATSLVKIANKFVEYYKIKQYAPSTVSILIGDVVKRLEKEEFIKNEGDMRHPNLKLTKSDFKDFSFIDEKKPKLNIPTLRSIMINSKEGITLEELKETYEIEGSCIRQYLSENYIKLKERNSYNREINRYIHEKFYKEKEVENTGKLNTKITYSPIDVVNVKKALKGKQSKRNKSTHYIDATMIASQANVTLEKLEIIIQEKFPKLMTFKNRKDELKIVYKSHYKYEKVPKEQRKGYLSLLKDIETLKNLLEQHKKGLRTFEIEEKLSWNRPKMYRCLRSKEASEVFTKFNEFVFLSKYYKNELKHFPIRVQLQAMKYNITHELVLNIIKENPNCGSSDIERALLKYCNYNIESTMFHSLVSCFKKDLEKKGLIVYTSIVGRVHIKDKEHFKSVRRRIKLKEPELIEFIKNKKYGATTGEVHAFIGNVISQASLYSTLNKLSEIVKVRVISENNKCGAPYELRWFMKDNVCLKENEDLYDCL